MTETMMTQAKLARRNSRRNASRIEPAPGPSGLGGFGGGQGEGVALTSSRLPES